MEGDRMELYSKGQGATEYLVLLAVVLMIALVSIALLGFFPGLAGDAKKTQSDSYWKSARPFGVVEHTQAGAGTTFTIMVQNNDPDQRKITALAAEGGCTLAAQTALLNAGEKKQYVLASCTACGATGAAYEHYLNITYDTNDLTSLKQIGTKPLVGKCT